MKIGQRLVHFNRTKILQRAMSRSNEKPSEVDSAEIESNSRHGTKRKLSEEACEAGTAPEEKCQLKKSISNDQDSEYYFENGLRKVYPYYFRYQTYAKGRWIGRTLYDVFVSEFRARKKEHYEEAVQSGKILVDGEKVSAEYRVKNNVLLTNDAHRHEVPVLGCPIKIIHEDEHMLVVDKPPSVPVHPCGRYRLNTILFILKKEHGIENLHTLHRLDRLTSGLLMFAKTKERSMFMDEQIRTHSVSKQYLCRVEGEFPEEEIVVEKPLKVYSFKIGVSGVHDDGRDAKTTFKRLSFNGKSSVVLAEPKQGRMHQIRVHLQYIGHPIVNDYLYNDEIFGKNKAKGGLTEKTPQELVTQLMEKHTLENWLKPMSEAEIAERKRTYGTKLDSTETINKSTDDFFASFPKSFNHYITEDFRKNLQGYDQVKMIYENTCPECNMMYRDPSPKDLLIYLHCYKYWGNGFEYVATWPNWAKEDWDYD